MGQLVFEQIAFYTVESENPFELKISFRTSDTRTFTEQAGSIDDVLQVGEQLTIGPAVLGDSDVIYAGFETINGVEFHLMLFEGPAGFAGQSCIVGTMDTSSDPLLFPNDITFTHGDNTPFSICFSAGTLISTPNGERNVELLAIGDQILTKDGHAVSVKWLGRQTLLKWRHGAHMQPVRIRKGALGDGLPHSDLTVTADHGMVLPSNSDVVGDQDDGYVINASALVNGDTIDWVPMAELDDSFTVYHIETEAHNVILANGAPAETFVDAVTRSHFDNYQEYLDLYGVERIIPEMNRPRISSARLVPQAIKDKCNTGLALQHDQPSRSVA